MQRPIHCRQFKVFLLLGGCSKMPRAWCRVGRAPVPLRPPFDADAYSVVIGGHRSIVDVGDAERSKIIHGAIVRERAIPNGRLDSRHLHDRPFAEYCFPASARVAGLSAAGNLPYGRRRFGRSSSGYDDVSGFDPLSREPDGGAADFLD